MHFLDFFFAEVVASVADAIVAVEYYMEMLQAGRPDPWPMLENAEQCLAALEPADGKVVVLRGPRPETEAEAEVCRLMGFKLVQGYLTGRPVPVDEPVPAPANVQASA